jgi:hypothetical protein
MRGDLVSKPAQPGIAADRFAREIVSFLTWFCAARSRQLNARPLDGNLLVYLTDQFVYQRCFQFYTLKSLRRRQIT